MSELTPLGRVLLATETHAAGKLARSRTLHPEPEETTDE